MKRQLRRLIVPVGATLRDVMRGIDAGGQGVALVVETRDRLVGLMTDGDVRRAILGGHGPESRAVRLTMRRDFLWVPPDVGRAEVLDLMRARSISQVPVLGPGRRLLGLHTLRDLMGSTERPNWAVIMAGGKGVRLRPITDTVPKPMIRVAGRPILERLVLHLTSYGIRRIFISVNHLAHVIEGHFGDGSGLGCRIEYLREEEPLGTAGGLSLLRQRPRDPVLVLNGDLLTQVDLGHLFAFHARGRFVATMGVRPFTVVVPYGVAAVHGRRLVGLHEKPTDRMLINAGVYVLSPRVLRMVPKRRALLMTELLQRCLDRRLSLGACLIQDEWADIGHHEELTRARGDT